MAALLVCGCMETEFPNDCQEGSKVFTATFEEMAETKTYVNENLKQLWHADDRLSIFTTTYNQQYRFTGETGASGGNFEELAPSGAQSGLEVSTVYAVYPYNSTTVLNEDEIIELSLPAVQAYAEGSFGLGANTMVAVSSCPTDYLLPFRNLCGYLVVKLYGSATVKSVALKGNGGEKIAGAATVMATYGAAPMLKMTGDATETITVDCGEGVALGADASSATEFWFCIPPVSFAKGFTVTVTDTKGVSVEYSTAISRRVMRNVMTTMAPIEADFTPAPVDLGLSVKWAGVNVCAESPEDVGGRFAWGEVEPKTSFDWTNYIWCKGSLSSMTKYCTKSSYGEVDGKTKLDAEDDAARAIMGGKWRMPTKAELDELVSECEWTYSKLNGVNGFTVTGPSGNSIFLPCNGQYDESGLHWGTTLSVIWSSENDGTAYAYSLGVSSTGKPGTDCAHHRHDGECVRAVYDSTL